MTTDPRLWLLVCADKLAARSALPVDVVALTQRLEIGIRWDDLQSAKHHGEVRRTISGRYEIIASSGDSESRQRFTLAHELAHILLDKRFSLRPTSKREYWHQEELCNEFAGRLLVPNAQLDDVVLDTPRAALNALWRIRAICQVSPETAARRLTECNRNVAYFAVEATTNAQGAMVFEVAWRAGSAAGPPTPERGSYLGADDPLWVAISSAAPQFTVEQHILGATSRQKYRLTTSLLQRHVRTSTGPLPTVSGRRGAR